MRERCKNSRETLSPIPSSRFTLLVFSLRSPLSQTLGTGYRSGGRGGGGRNPGIRGAGSLKSIGGGKREGQEARHSRWREPGEMGTNCSTRQKPLMKGPGVKCLKVRISSDPIPPPCRGGQTDKNDLNFVQVVWC